MLTLATSVQQPDTVTFYNIVVFIHILAAIVAFGVTASYPIVDAALHRPGNLHHLPWWHRMQTEIGRKVINGRRDRAADCRDLPCGARDRTTSAPRSSRSASSSSSSCSALGGAFFAPTERKAAELAERDVAASAGGEVKLSPEYEAVAGRLRVAGITSTVLVVLAVFLMVNKPL